MSVDLDLTETFLYYLVTIGPPALAAILLLAGLGVPVPGTLFVLATGAFIRQGVLDFSQTILLALLGVVVGDTLSYGMGRLFRTPVYNRFGHKEPWQKAEIYFQRRGGLAIYLTRFLFTPLAVPTNLIAGTSGYPFARFLLFDISGELTWLLLFGLIGYSVGSQWELVSDLVTDFSGFLVGALLLGAGLYLLRHRLGWSDGFLATQFQREKDMDK